jgi:hypothetical protein
MGSCTHSNDTAERERLLTIPFVVALSDLRTRWTPVLTFPPTDVTRALLVTQREHRIDPRRAHRRNVAGQHGDANQHNRNTEER